MDPVRNPFAPGAGSQPPELAGRDAILTDADIALQRVLLGRHARSQILLGLRGTGKTVLLNRIERMARQHGHETSFVEAPEDRRLADILYPQVHSVLRRLSFIEASKHLAYRGMRALRGFASVFKVKVNDVSISVDAEPGLADSGDLETDLAELFVVVGEAAKAASRAWSLFIDEIQYLETREYASLIVALHRTNQRELPVMLFGAGLPQVAALSGDAKSYAERLFLFPVIGPLDLAAALDAILQPVKSEGEEITEDALRDIFAATKGYPYFLQEWGYQSWNAADQSPISAEDVELAGALSLARLDEGFFRVRLDRLTPKEREYVMAMSRLGEGPFRSSDVADELGEHLTKLGPRRAQIISKGMIYSPAHGDIDFTVPMFGDYLRRIAKMNAH